MSLSAVLFVVIFGANGQPQSVTTTPFPSWGVCRQAEARMEQRLRSRQIQLATRNRAPAHDSYGRYVPPAPIHLPPPNYEVYCESQ
jgi:hypothetical protein